jgi:hypothetical protein
MKGSTMNSKTFRERATTAVDMVARFMDEFPEVYCVVRIGDKSSDMEAIIGIAEKQKEDENDED